MMTITAVVHFLTGFSFLLAEISAEEYIVKLNHGGEIRGNTLETEKGRMIYAFRGIPYAEPPVGQLRFKNPVPKTPWKDQPFNATEDGPMCVQVSEAGNLTGQEDCLSLNVYSPKLPGKDKSDIKMAVMVFIHGGGFVTGSCSSYWYSPGRLLDEDIIMVAMNYRLGALGFLSTGDAVSPGNYGLLDQLLALKWVKEHIEVFGGDPKQVTIFGESAGAASVAFHVLSPMSAGLFHAAIAQSGSPLAEWSLQKNPEYWATRLAEDLDCSTQDSDEIIECMRQIPAERIIEIPTRYSFQKYGLMPSTFIPSVDGSFLPKPPRQIISSGEANLVPYLSGITKDEGLLVYGYLYLDPNMSDLKHNVEKLIAYMLDKEGNAEEATKLVMDEYFSRIDWTNETSTRLAIVELFSDAMFKVPHYETLNLLAKNGFRLYTYSLDYSPSVGLLQLLGIKENWGVCHADDLGLLFYKSMGLTDPTEDDKKIMRVLVPLWINFAKYSNPTPDVGQDSLLKWETSDFGKMEIYHIDNPVTTSTYEPNEDHIYKFWSEIVPQHLNKTVHPEQFYL